jgi:hypothetical protein
MAKGQLRSTKETRKPKKEKPAAMPAVRSVTASALAQRPVPAGQEKPKH